MQGDGGDIVIPVPRTRRRRSRPNTQGSGSLSAREPSDSTSGPPSELLLTPPITVGGREREKPAAATDGRGRGGAAMPKLRSVREAGRRNPQSQGRRPPAGRVFPSAAAEETSCDSAQFALLLEESRNGGDRKVGNGGGRRTAAKGEPFALWKGGHAAGEGRRGGAGASAKQQQALAGKGGWEDGGVADGMLMLKENMCKEVIVQNESLLQQLEKTEAQRVVDQEIIRRDAARLVDEAMWDQKYFRELAENQNAKLKKASQSEKESRLALQRAYRVILKLAEQCRVLRRFADDLRASKHTSDHQAQHYRAAYESITASVRAVSQSALVDTVRDALSSAAVKTSDSASQDLNFKQVVVQWTEELRKLQNNVLSTQKTLSNLGLEVEVPKGQRISRPLKKEDRVVDLSELQKVKRSRDAWEAKCTRTMKEEAALTASVQALGKTVEEKANAIVKLRGQMAQLKKDASESSSLKATVTATQKDLEEMRAKQEELKKQNEILKKRVVKQEADLSAAQDKLKQQPAPPRKSASDKNPAILLAPPPRTSDDEPRRSVSLVNSEKRQSKQPAAPPLDLSKLSSKGEAPPAQASGGDGIGGMFRRLMLGEKQEEPPERSASSRSSFKRTVSRVKQKAPPPAQLLEGTKPRSSANIKRTVSTVVALKSFNQFEEGGPDRSPSRLAISPLPSLAVRRTVSRVGRTETKSDLPPSARVPSRGPSLAAGRRTVVISSSAERPELRGPDEHLEEGGPASIGETHLDEQAAPVVPPSATAIEANEGGSVKSEGEKSEGEEAVQLATTLTVPPSASLKSSTLALQPSDTPNEDLMFASPASPTTNLPMIRGHGSLGNWAGNHGEGEHEEMRLSGPGADATPSFAAEPERGEGDEPVADGPEGVAVEDLASVDEQSEGLPTDNRLTSIAAESHRSAPTSPAAESPPVEAAILGGPPSGEEEDAAAAPPAEEGGDPATAILGGPPELPDIVEVASLRRVATRRVQIQKTRSEVGVAKPPSRLLTGAGVGRRTVGTVMGGGQLSAARSTIGSRRTLSRNVVGGDANQVSLKASAMGFFGQ